IDGWPARRPAPSAGPLCSHQLSMPANERLRGDHERGPPAPMKAPTRCGEEHAVDGLELRPVRLSFQNAELMAKNKDLKFLRAAIGGPPSQQSGQRMHDEGQE